MPALVTAPVVALLSVQLPARTGMSRPVRVALAGGVLLLLFILSRAASRPWTNTVALYVRFFFLAFLAFFFNF